MHPSIANRDDRTNWEIRLAATRTSFLFAAVECWAGAGVLLRTIFDWLVCSGVTSEINYKTELNQYSQWFYQQFDANAIETIVPTHPVQIRILLSDFLLRHRHRLILEHSLFPSRRGFSSCYSCLITDLLFIFISSCRNVKSIIVWHERLTRQIFQLAALIASDVASTENVKASMCACVMCIVYVERLCVYARVPMCVA